MRTFKEGDLFYILNINYKKSLLLFDTGKQFKLKGL